MGPLRRPNDDEIASIRVAEWRDSIDKAVGLRANAFWAVAKILPFAGFVYIAGAIGLLCMLISYGSYTTGGFFTALVAIALIGPDAWARRVKVRYTEVVHSEHEIPVVCQLRYYGTPYASDIGLLHSEDGFAYYFGSQIDLVLSANTYDINPAKGSARELNDGRFSVHFLDMRLARMGDIDSIGKATRALREELAVAAERRQHDELIRIQAPHISNPFESLQSSLLTNAIRCATVLASTLLTLYLFSVHAPAILVALAAAIGLLNAFRIATCSGRESLDDES